MQYEMSSLWKRRTLPYTSSMSLEFQDTMQTSQHDICICAHCARHGTHEAQLLVLLFSKIWFLICQQLQSQLQQLQQQHQHATVLPQPIQLTTNQPVTSLSQQTTTQLYLSKSIPASAGTTVLQGGAVGLNSMAGAGLPVIAAAAPGMCTFISSLLLV